MKTFRDLLSEVRGPQSGNDKEFFKKSGLNNPEVTTDPQNGDNAHKAKSVKTYKGKGHEKDIGEGRVLGNKMSKAGLARDTDESDREYIQQRSHKNQWKKDNPGKTYPGFRESGGKYAGEKLKESISSIDKARGKIEKHHPTGGKSAETPIKEETEILTEDEMAARSYVYERIFSLIDDISDIINEFYTEEKDYENEIRSRAKAKKPVDEPWPEYPTRPWNLRSTYNGLDDIYQALLTATKYDPKAVFEETELEEISKQTLQSYKNKASSDASYYKAERDYNQSNHDKPGQGDGAKAHYKKTADKFAKKLKNRTDGMAKASKRLGEEVEEIDEISKKTLGSYVEKGDRSYGNLVAAADKKIGAALGMSKTPHKSHAKRLKDEGDTLMKKADRRAGFLNKAEKKLKEETELSELSQTTKTNYLMAATADRAAAGKENDEAINKAKKVGGKDPIKGRELLKIAKKAAERRERRAKGLSKL